jgi:hypothetical protein
MPNVGHLELRALSYYLGALKLLIRKIKFINGESTVKNIPVSTPLPFD